MPSAMWQTSARGKFGKARDKQSDFVQSSGLAMPDNHPAMLFFSAATLARIVVITIAVIQIIIVDVIAV
jgi:hypothetical protein